MADPQPPTTAELESILSQVGAAQEVPHLPPDLGSSGRLHVYIFGDVVVKCDQSADGRRCLRERCALDLLKDCDLPVPRLLGWGQWRSGQGWVALSRLDGAVPPDAARLAHHVSPGLAAQMGAVCARLHAGPTPPGFGSWARGPCTLLEDHRVATANVVEMARGSDLISAGELAKLEAEITSLQGSLDTAPGTPVLVHRDIQPRNVLVDEAGNLCALLDFETAAGGDPAEDFSPIGLDWDDPGFPAFCAGYAQAGGRLDRDAPTRVAHRLLNWALLIFAYLGHIVPDYLQPARRVWARIEAGERPDLSPLIPG